MEKKDLKVALVHDFLDQYGGAERVLEVLCEMFPEAPIYTLLYDKEKMFARRGSAFGGREIHTSFLQKFPKFLRQNKKWLLPFMPTAPETFNLRDFDLIISSSGAWSKGIVTRLNTVHVSYIHSPMRFVWDVNEEYLKNRRIGKRIGFLARLVLNYVRVWDKAAGDRPDHLIANSIYTQKRIKKYYGRESKIIYPPVFMRQATSDNRQADKNPSPALPLGKGENTANQELKTNNYFLVVSRLSAYKNIDAIVEAFNKLELPLLVVGEGEESARLKNMAGKNVKFLGWQKEENLAEIYAASRAFIFAAEDDFGIAPVEAMAQGVPVLALRKGGALETVMEGKTGEFFDSKTPEIIADTVRRFMENEKNYDKKFIKQRAGEFSKERFIREFNDFLEKIVK
jgi:glycosyltransferase involved in cell wall biosynthesis